MTAKEVLDKFEKLTEKANKERALYYLLRSIETDVERILEQDKLEGFHRSFRIGTGTSNPYINTAIWILLNESELFWQVFEDDSIPKLNKIDLLKEIDELMEDQLSSDLQDKYLNMLKDIVDSLRKDINRL